ncbi:MAG: LuxR C-terminal-related transcriptional regulator [Bacteroidota bacterium]
MIDEASRQLTGLLSVIEMPEERFVLVSSSSRELLGWEPAYLVRLGSRIWDVIFLKQDLAPARHRLMDLVEEAGMGAFHFRRMRTKNDGWKWFQGSYRVLTRFTDGRPWHLLGQYAEVTDTHPFLSASFEELAHDLRRRRYAPERERLTPREQQVVEMIARGCTDRDIAGQLNISPHTAESHRRNAMQKLNAGGVADLVRASIRLGLVAP